MKLAVILYLVFVLLGSALAIKHQVSQNLSTKDHMLDEVEDFDEDEDEACMGDGVSFNNRYAY